MDLLNRYLGTLVGVHVGDSRGAPYETWSVKQIKADIEKRGDIDLFDYKNPWSEDGNGDILPAGRPTDDSDQTADLADSLTRCGGLNVDDLRRSLRRSVIDGKSLLWNGQATGAGKTTKAALSDDEEKQKKGLNNNIGTNGSLMRCSPMALWFGPGQFHSPENCKLVHDMSQATHTHTHSKQACWMYTKILQRILRGTGTWWSYDYKLQGEVEVRIFSRLRDNYDFPYDPGKWPMRGTAEFSLYVALYALNKTKSFTEGIEMAVSVGGDTDTYAAIAGGLLGAHYGYEAIPDNWKNVILGHDVMVEYAKKLYDMHLSK